MSSSCSALSTSTTVHLHSLKSSISTTREDAPHRCSHQAGPRGGEKDGHVVGRHHQAGIDPRGPAGRCIIAAGESAGKGGLACQVQASCKDRDRLLQPMHSHQNPCHGGHPLAAPAAVIYAVNNRLHITLRLPGQLLTGIWASTRGSPRMVVMQHNRRTGLRGFPVLPPQVPEPQQHSEQHPLTWSSRWPADAPQHVGRWRTVALAQPQGRRCVSPRESPERSRCAGLACNISMQRA